MEKDGSIRAFDQVQTSSARNSYHDRSFLSINNHLSGVSSSLDSLLDLTHFQANEIRTLFAVLPNQEMCERLIDNYWKEWVRMTLYVSLGIECLRSSSAGLDTNPLASGSLPFRLAIMASRGQFLANAYESSSGARFKYDGLSCLVAIYLSPWIRLSYTQHRRRPCIFKCSVLGSS
jgi:hypothetical protein